MKNRFKVTALSLFVIIQLIPSQVFASGTDVIYNREPVEEVIDGQLYYDGIPVLEEQEIHQFTDNQGSTYYPTSTDLIVPFGINSWTKVSTSEYYTGQDWDRYENRASSSVKRTLSTTSTMTISITGSTKFSFKSVAELEMGATVGTTYTKTTSEEFTIPAGWVYEQKTAKKVIQRNYEYTDVGLFFTTTYSAISHGHGGTTTWLWSNPL